MHVLAEAARLAVAQKLNVKLLIDDNNVTIAVRPRGEPPEPESHCGSTSARGPLVDSTSGTMSDSTVATSA